MPDVWGSSPARRDGIVVIGLNRPIDRECVSLGDRRPVSMSHDTPWAAAPSLSAATQRSLGPVWEWNVLGYAGRPELSVVSQDVYVMR